MEVICRWLCGVLLLTASAVAGTAPSIVLITLDTTRADRMDFLGSPRRLTPNLDALAEQSAVFTHAYSQAPLTSVSHATILTGTYPQYHGVVDFPMVLAADLPDVPELLRKNGYHTAAFLGSLALDPKGGAPGFDRGFDVYDANFRPEDFEAKGRYQSVERRGEEVIAHALQWLDKRPQGPFFLWVHLYDPHDPYDPPEPYKTRYAKNLYDGEIAHVDAVAGKLLQALKARGLFDNTLITVTADHGESLGAHGEDTHGVFIYDETIQVPLLIKLPREATGAPADRKPALKKTRLSRAPDQSPQGTKSTASGKRIDSRVELVDIMPTMLEVVKMPTPTQVQGKSLLELIQAPKGEVPEAWRDRLAYSQVNYASFAYGWAPLQSLRTGKYLYIQAPRRELYDETGDPKAEHNLAPEAPAVADTLATKLTDFRQKTSSTRHAPKAEIDPDRMKQLAALGYVVSAGSASMGGASEQGADPKDRIQIVGTIRHLENLMWGKHYQEAIPILQQLGAQFPDMVAVQLKLANCYMELHQYLDAIAPLRKVVALYPNMTSAQMDLGKSLLRTGDFNGGAAALQKAADQAPDRLDAQVLLAVAYARADRVPETIRQCNKVLEMIPDHYGTTLLLGRFLAESGDHKAAAEKLERAAILRPQAPEPHEALADVYDHLGRSADAARERAEAQRLGGGSE